MSEERTITMNENLDSLSYRKWGLVNSLFINTADQDYLAARWAFQNRLINQYLSSAGFALEKLGKAFLLVNEINVTPYGHNLTDIYKQIDEIDENNMLSSSIQIPAANVYGAQRFTGITYIDFINWFDFFANPDGRYNSLGHDVYGVDIIVFDRIYLWLRGKIRTSHKLSDVKVSPWVHYFRKNTPRRMKFDWVLNGEHHRMGILEQTITSFIHGNENSLTTALFHGNFSVCTLKNSNKTVYNFSHFWESPIANSSIRLNSKNFFLRFPQISEVSVRQTNLELEKWGCKNIPRYKKILGRYKSENVENS